MVSKARPAAAFIAIAALVAAGCGSATKPAENPAPAQQQAQHPEWAQGKSLELVMVSYGGTAQEPHRNFLAAPMEQKYPGLKIRLVPSSGQDTVAQIKAAAGRSPFDLMPNDDPAHLTLIADNLLAKADPATIPNLKDVYPEFIKAGQGYGVPATYSLMGIAYNTSKVKTPLKGWNDLANPEYKGRVGVTPPRNNLGLGFLVAMAKANGGSETDLEPGFKAIQGLGKVPVAANPSALSQLLERGEVDIAPMWSTEAAVLASKGLPIKFVKPDPGAIAVISHMSVIKNASLPVLSSELLNDVISVEYQTKAAARPYFFGPTNKNVKVPAEAAEYIPATPEEVQKLQTVDWAKVVPNRNALVDRWNKLFGQ